MEIVKQPPKVFSAAVGKQKFDKSKKYKKNPFIIETMINDNSCIYNTFTGMMIILQKNEYEDFNFRKQFTPVNEQLVEDWFLIDEDINIFEFYQHYKSTVNFLLYNGSINQYTILPTTDCNARCFYCYEKNIKKESMTLDKAKDVSEYILKTADKNGIELRWFGGEPLFNKDAIDEICSILKEKKIKYKSSIITNGLLFSSDLINTAKELWNLKQVQITLDGTEKVYNYTKNYIYTDICNPFEVVLNNILSLLEENIKVIIRLNISKTNLDDLYDLVTIISERFKGKNRLLVYTSVLYQLRKSLFNPTQDNIGFIEKINKLNNYIYSNNLNNNIINNKSYKLNNCMADNKGAVLISPEGKLHRCDHYSEDDVVGDIKNGMVDSEKVEYFCKESYLDECKECPFLPICNHLPYCESYIENCNSIYKVQLQREFDKYLLNTVKKWKNRSYNL